VHACGGFLRHAFDLVAHFGEPAGGLRHPLFDLCLNRDFFFRRRDSDHVFAGFGTAPSRM